MNRLPDVEREYRGELIRKGIHLSSLLIPVGYSFLDRGTMLWILTPVTAVFLLTDLARLYVPSFRAWYHRLFGWLMRHHEKGSGSRHLNGASYVLLSACLCVLVFPRVIAITAFTILIVSDTVAALIGRKFGRHRFLAKTREGATGFLLSALLVVILVPKAGAGGTEYFIGGIGAVTGTVVESLPVNVDDNLSIPLTIGGIMWILYALLLPGSLIL